MMYTHTKFSTELAYLKNNGSIARSIEKERTKKSIFYTIK
jgi:hypothetical protein